MQTARADVHELNVLIDPRHFLQSKIRLFLQYQGAPHDLTIIQGQADAEYYQYTNDRDRHSDKILLKKFFHCEA